MWQGLMAAATASAGRSLYKANLRDPAKSSLRAARELQRASIIKEISQQKVNAVPISEKGRKRGTKTLLTSQLILISSPWICQE